MRRLYDYLKYALPDLGFIGGGKVDTARLSEKPRPFIPLPSYEPLFSEANVLKIEQDVIKIIEVPAMNPFAILVSKLESLLASKAENQDGEEINRRIESSVAQPHFIGIDGNCIIFLNGVKISPSLTMDILNWVMPSLRFKKFKSVKHQWFIWK